MSASVTEDSAGGSSLEGLSSAQQCKTSEVAEWRSSDQVENGTPSTSPLYWDTDDSDDDGGNLELFRLILIHDLLFVPCFPVQSTNNNTISKECKVVNKAHILCDVNFRGLGLMVLALSHWCLLKWIIFLVTDK